MAKRTKKTKPDADTKDAASNPAAAAFTAPGAGKAPSPGVPNTPSQRAALQRRANLKPKDSPFNEQGHLDRAGMEAVIAKGGSVTWQGEVIEHASFLPSDEDIAKARTRRVEDDEAAIDSQIAGLQARRDRIRARREPASKK